MLQFKKVLQLLALWCMLAIVAVTHAEQLQYLPDMQVVDLKPQMQPSPLTATLYSVSTENLITYLRNFVMFESKEQFNELPYVVGFDQDKRIAGPGDIAYTRGLNSKGDISSYSFLIPGKTFVNPGTEEVIGFQALVSGTAEIKQFGDPQTIMIVSALTTIEAGTKLIPSVGIDLPAVIDARYPDKAMSGYVLAVSLNQAGGGQFSVVMLSLTKKDGLKQGHVLDLIDGQRKVQDVNKLESVSLPPDKFGEVFIYKVGERISLGIVTYSTHMVLPNDVVRVLPQDF
jgi:hypothetical protein